MGGGGGGGVGREGCTCVYMICVQGFHRYSTDEFWHVPHFEKMLYDQAQLACVYLEAYQVRQRERERDK